VNNTKTDTESCAGSSVAEESSQARRAFLSNVRNELLTPINVIVGYSEILLEDGQKHPNFAPDLEKIASAGKQLLGVIDSSLDQGKIEQSDQTGDLEAFVARTRHDLRTPLNAIIGYGEILLEDAKEVGEDACCPDIEQILTAARHLLSSIGNVVEFYMSSRSSQEIEGSTSPYNVARDAVDTLHTRHNRNILTPNARLLVVDDSELNRDILCRRLQHQGYRVDAAENGRQAMQMLRAQPFDVVLLDVMMPEMNGYQVLETVKNDDRLRHIPIIMISAFDDVESVAHCIQMGAEDYLPKTFNPVLLKARIEGSLEKKRLRDREQAYLEQIRCEQEKSEQLLLNILPEAIAKRLKAGETVIADSWPEVTVLFSDLVNFTRYSAGVSALDLVNRLNEIFQALDELIVDHGLEKIKTIGDAYMLAGGLPSPRPDHAEAVANMALDMTARVQELNAGYDVPLQVRIGIHTGPVVAGIIGHKKFTYDLWGDTVNTASRMESHGIPGRIQISEATYAQLRDRFAVEKRSPISVKGKGQMTTYFLLDKKTQPDNE
jgi:class 3 adenylate cyclase